MSIRRFGLFYWCDLSAPAIARLAQTLHGIRDICRAVQAAEQRNLWFPRFAPGYWMDAIYLDVCLLVPLIAYDYFSAKRLHQATIAASCVLLGAQGVLLFVWGKSRVASSASYAALLEIEMGAAIFAW